MLIKTHELTPGVHPAQLQIYNGLDCCLTFEIWEVLKGMIDDHATTTYSFERALQAPALEMMLRGFRIDQYKRAQGVAKLKVKQERLRTVLARYAFSVWGRDLNPQSPKQLIEFFYGAMRLPEQWASAKGVKRLSTNREALEKLEVYFHAMPIVAVILALRDISKQLSVLETEIDFDGRMRTSYNIAGTETGRWSSSSSAEGTGCVPPDTEVLTRNGWRRIDSIIPGTEIVQYDDGALEFVPCTIHSEPFIGDMLVLKTEQIQQTLTPCHRVLHFGFQNDRVLVEPAQTVAMRGQTYLPLGGTFTDGTIAYPAFLSMLMADFSKEPTGWRGAFKKQRKINRFLQLAHEFNIPYTEQSAKDGYRRFYVPGFLHFPKTWGEWVLNLSQSTAQLLLEEARYWDSHDRGSGFIFFTASQDQAEWFATLAHLAGRSATIRLEQQNAGSYSTTLMWWVNVKTRSYAQVKAKHWSTTPYSGQVYCPQVPSSFWLMRQNGSISITGNTNLQNIARDLRDIFIADEGWKLCGIDLEQAESREVGWQTGILFDDWAYLDACYAGDLHTFVCKMTWPDLKWTGDPKADKALAERKFYREYSRRDMAKKLGHGSNYHGKPFTMARHAKIPVKLAEAFQHSYFEAFPGIPRWHRHVAQQLQTVQHLSTPWDRTRYFFGRPNDDATLREAIAFVPQSSTGDRMNRGLYNIWESMGSDVQLIAQVHDAVYFQFRAEKEQDLIPQALALIDIRIKQGARELIVPGEAKLGWNWGDMSPTNPDGLKKFKLGQPDTRTRASALDRIM